MAFTGSATVEQITDGCCRITGLSLAAGASGTIALDGTSGAEVELPAGFMPRPYADVSLIDQIKVGFVPATAVATAIPIRVVKTGTKPLDFVITLTNDHASTTSPELEIYVEQAPA